MAETMGTNNFEHNGFMCTIQQRSDLCYASTVYGRRKSDDKIFYPDVIFDRDMTHEQIESACIDMMDGKFTGTIERHGNLAVVVV